MGQLNSLYRAFLSYKNELANNSDITKERNKINENQIELTKLEIVKNECDIEEDWIKAIEDGLEFVEKAIREERQFIRTEGNVTPIEKAKRVNKSSVEHLSKHSDLITHLPEDGSDDIVPDKLYVVERLSDYAVYENRFLYMLLCYLRDFIALKYDAIIDTATTYHANFFFKKDVEVNDKVISFETKLSEDRKKDEFLLNSLRKNSLITRIETIRFAVNALLSTSLIDEVSKSPMIKPPITKTNVLRMNNNFKRSLELYDYVQAYKGQGYSVRTIKSNYCPLKNDAMDDFTQQLILTSFLAYEYGNDIKSDLHKQYLVEEEERRIIEKNKLAEKIKMMKKRLSANEITLEEYLITLEQRVRDLEADSAQLKISNDKISELNKEIDSLNDVVGSLRDILTNKNKEIDNLQTDFDNKLADVNKLHSEEINSIQNQCKEDIENAKKQFIDDMNNLENQVSQLTQEKESMLYDCENRISEAQQSARAQISMIQDETNTQLMMKETQYQEVLHQKTFLAAQLHGIRQQHGLITSEEDYTSKERFDELENEFMAFQDFFHIKWKETKKRIRKEQLWNFKDTSKENKEETK